MNYLSVDPYDLSHDELICGFYEMQMKVAAFEDRLDTNRHRLKAAFNLDAGEGRILTALMEREAVTSKALAFIASPKTNYEDINPDVAKSKISTLRKKIKKVNFEVKITTIPRIGYTMDKDSIAIVKSILEKSND